MVKSGSLAQTATLSTIFKCSVYEIVLFGLVYFFPIFPLNENECAYALQGVFRTAVSTTYSTGNSLAY